MKKILILAVLTVFLTGCGKLGGGDRLDVTLDGRARAVELREGMLLVLQQGSNGPQSMAQYQILLSNVELSKPSDVNKKLTAEGDTVVTVEVYGKRGTTRETPLAVENFPAGGAGSTAETASFGSVFVTTFADGREVRRTPADFAGPKTGAVKFTEISGDTVRGTVDLTVGDKLRITGSFTAKVRPKGA